MITKLQAADAPLPTRVLDFRCVASFRNENASKAAGATGLRSQESRHTVPDTFFIIHSFKTSAAP